MSAGSFDFGLQLYYGLAVISIRLLLDILNGLSEWIQNEYRIVLLNYDLTH